MGAKKKLRRVLSLPSVILVALAAAGCISDDSEADEQLDDVEQSATLSPIFRVGLTGNDMFNKGPEFSGGDWTSTNPYTIGLGYFSPKSLPSMITTAREKGILIVLNMAGNRNLWTNARTINGKECLIYDAGKYRARIDLFVGVSGLASALADRRVIVYVVDEPNIDDFCDSITPSEANAMGLYIKRKWPGAITMLRSSASTMKNGFAGQGPLGANFWTGIDYGYGLYKGFMKDRDGLTPAEWFSAEKRRFADLNLGMVAGINYLNHGDQSCWDAKNDGSSSGRIRGQNQSSMGFVSCSTDPGKEINWLASPKFLRQIVDYIVTDKDVPFLAIWSHATPGTSWDEFKVYEIRKDFVDTWKYMLAKGKARTSWNGWRRAK